MKRPGIITFICIIGYLTVLVTFPQVFSPGVKKLGLFVPAIYGILVAAHFISCVGLWFYKQWGLQLYVLTFFAKTLFYLLTAQTGIGFYVHLSLSLVFIVILLRFYPKMSANL
jgi:hypothetical protein